MQFRELFLLLIALIPGELIAVETVGASDPIRSGDESFEYPAPVLPVPIMDIVYRADFTGLSNFTQEIAAGATEELRLPANLPQGTYEWGRYQPIGQGRPLQVLAQVPGTARGQLKDAAQIGSMNALSFSSTGGAGMVLRFPIRNLTPGATYAANALISARAEQPVVGVMMQVTGAGISLAPESSDTTTPKAPRVRALQVVFIAPADGMVEVAIVNPRAEDPVYIRNVEIRTHPEHDSVPTADALPKPGNRFDFSTVRWRELFVAVDNPAASDANSGSLDAPLKTLGAGLAKAAPLLREGIPVRLNLAAGIYREGRATSAPESANPLTLDAVAVGGRAVSTPLAIVGSEAGQVIISGAERFTQWTLENSQLNLWRHPWTYNWGPSDHGWEPIKDPLAQRSEMLVVDGKVQQLVLLETVTYQRGRFTDYGPGASRNEKGRWILGTYQSPEKLKPGEFGVSELGPGETIKGMQYDGHSDPNTLWSRLPPGTDATRSLMEIGMRRNGLRLLGKDQVLLRNLTISHYLREGMQINTWPPTWRSQNYLIEHCSFSRNMEVGFVPAWVDGLTIKDCHFDENGRGKGADFLFVRNALLTDSTLDHNGIWRRDTTGAPFCYGWVGSGENITFERCSISDNGGNGFRQDHVGQHLRFEQCRIERNKGAGMSFEIARGPILLNGCQVRNNTGSGLWFSSVDNVTINSCQVINNLPSIAILPENSGQGFTGEIVVSNHPRPMGLNLLMWGAQIMDHFPFNRNFTLKNSMVAGNAPGGFLITHRSHEEKSPNIPAYIAWYQQEYHGSGNAFWHSGNSHPFQLNTQWVTEKQQPTDLAGWQLATGQDLDARWQKP